MSKGSGEDHVPDQSRSRRSLKLLGPQDSAAIPIPLPLKTGLQQMLKESNFQLKLYTMEHSHPFDDFIPQNTKSKGLRSDEQRHERIMGKLKDSIFTTLEASNPSRPINQELKSHIAKQMHEFFPHFGTPTHPPYALVSVFFFLSLFDFFQVKF